MRQMTKFYVRSIDTCSVPGCNGRCVALDIMVADGKRCERHIPNKWLWELNRSEHELFGKKEHSKILDFSKVLLPIKGATLRQNEVDEILSLVFDKNQGSLG